MTDQKETYEVHYWLFKGRAELLRILLEAGGLEYTNRGVGDWDHEKPAQPFGQLPVLIIKRGGKETHVAQSGAIARYIASRAGLLPSDPVGALVNDSICEGIRELAERAVTWRFETEGEAAKTAVLQQFRSVHAPAAIKHLTRFAQQNGSSGYFQGSAATLADFTLFAVFENVNHWIPDTFTRENAPALFAIVDKVAALPRVKAYKQSDRCFPLFDYLEAQEEAKKNGSKSKG